MRDDAASPEETGARADPEAWAMRLDPVGAVIDVMAGESVLEAAARAAWQLPSSCRNGTCRACLCRLRAGKVRYRVDWPGLSAQERRAGWMLACVALPVSDVVVEQPDAAPVPAPRRATRGF